MHLPPRPIVRRRRYSPVKTLESPALSMSSGASGARVGEGEAAESLLVFSDVHLGSDLNDRLPPGDVLRRSQHIDHDLVRLLHHYRRTPPKGSRWRVVIA